MFTKAVQNKIDTLQYWSKPFDVVTENDGGSHYTTSVKDNAKNEVVEVHISFGYEDAEKNFERLKTKHIFNRS